MEGESGPEKPAPNPDQTPQVASTETSTSDRPGFLRGILEGIRQRRQETSQQGLRSMLGGRFEFMRSSLETSRRQRQEYYREKFTNPQTAQERLHYLLLRGTGQILDLESRLGEKMASFLRDRLQPKPQAPKAPPTAK